MSGVRSLRGSKSSRLFLLAVILLAAFAVAPAAASACSAGPYTECIPGSGHHIAGTSTAASVPTTSKNGGSGSGSGGSGSTAGSKSGSGANTNAGTQGNGGKTGNKDQQGGALPVAGGTPPSSGSGGGIPTIAWVLIALALIALVGGSILVLRNRRNAAGKTAPQGTTPGPNQPGTASDVS